MDASDEISHLGSFIHGYIKALKNIVSTDVLQAILIKRPVLGIPFPSAGANIISSTSDGGVLRIITFEGR